MGKAVAALAMAGVLAGLAGAGAPEPPRVVALTGEQNGYVEPCGCAKPMLGGLARRATLLSSLRPWLSVDNGDVAGGVGRQEEMKLVLSARALSAMGYAAVNVGEKDLRLGPALAIARDRAPLPWISANVRELGAAKPLFDPSRRIEMPAGNAFVVGVLDESFAPEVKAENPFLEVLPAREALLGELSKARPGDVVVALVHARRERAEAILAGLAGRVHLAVAAHEGDEPDEALADVAGIPTVLPGQRGKHLATVTLASSAPVLRSIPLEDELALHDGVGRLFQSYEEELRAERLLHRIVAVPHPSGDRYAGTEACVRCHPSAAAVWRESRHGRAWSTLQKNGHDWDPECVGCHVVGFRTVSGFAAPDRTPELVNVGCESCHGPSQAHAADGFTLTAHAALKGEAKCVGCHVPEHSPAFAFDAYWPRIKHGPEPPPLP